MDYSDHEKMDVYKVAIEFIALADEVAENLPRGRAYLEPVHKGLTAAREFIYGRIVPVSVDDATRPVTAEPAGRRRMR